MQPVFQIVSRQKDFQCQGPRPRWGSKEALGGYAGRQGKRRETQRRPGGNDAGPGKRMRGKRGKKVRRGCDGDNGGICGCLKCGTASRVKGWKWPEGLWAWGMCSSVGKRWGEKAVGQGALVVVGYRGQMPAGFSHLSVQLGQLLLIQVGLFVNSGLISELRSGVGQ